MKRYYLIAMAFVIFLSLAFIGYGVYLNSTSESLINENMEDRKFGVYGEFVGYHDIIPIAERQNIFLTSDQMTDSIARVEGVIVKMNVKRGDVVKQGDVICEVSNEEIPLDILQIDSKLAKADAVLIQSTRNYERLNKLDTVGAISKSNLDEAMANKQAAESEVQELMARKQQLLISQDRQKVRASIDGEVLMVYAKEGNFISAGTSVVMIADFSKLRFKEELDDKEVQALLSSDMNYKITFAEESFTKVYGMNYRANNPEKYQTFDIKIVDVKPPIAVPSFRRYLVWEIDNHTGILESGLYNDTKISMEAKRHVLAIPRISIENEAEPEVWVKNAAGVIEVREIETGIKDEKYIEVRSGLQENDILIVSGHEGLLPGMKVVVKGKEGEDIEK